MDDVFQLLEVVEMEGVQEFDEGVGGLVGDELFDLVGDCFFQRVVFCLVFEVVVFEQVSEWLFKQLVSRFCLIYKIV